MAVSVFKRFRSPQRPELEARIAHLADGLTPEAREALIQSVPLRERQAVRAMLTEPTHAA